MPNGTFPLTKDAGMAGSGSSEYKKGVVYVSGPLPHPDDTTGPTQPIGLLIDLHEACPNSTDSQGISQRIQSPVILLINATTPSLSSCSLSQKLSSIRLFGAKAIALIFAVDDPFQVEPKPETLASALSTTFGPSVLPALSVDPAVTRSLVDAFESAPFASYDTTWEQNWVSRQPFRSVQLSISAATGPPIEEGFRWWVVVAVVAAVVVLGNLAVAIWCWGRRRTKPVHGSTHSSPHGSMGGGDLAWVEMQYGPLRRNPGVSNISTTASIAPLNHHNRYSVNAGGWESGGEGGQGPDAYEQRYYPGHLGIPHRGPNGQPDFYRPPMHIPSRTGSTYESYDNGRGSRNESRNESRNGSRHGSRNGSRHDSIVIVPAAPPPVMPSNISITGRNPNTSHHSGRAVSPEPLPLPTLEHKPPSREMTSSPEQEAEDAGDGGWKLVNGVWSLSGGTPEQFGPPPVAMADSLDERGGMLVDGSGRVVAPSPIVGSDPWGHNQPVW
ncbi:hypothetical protein HK097_008545 [Rhizophlyctis rosea]|uniref:Uncharacterized protein n=1 Tax=Rhizophlyctis rosea TaxID=64517 RepID=A0AAD5SA61_9FUNG|nr:hypothetical protein HK097_008545 [Rhizophlyctis rosea]